MTEAIPASPASSPSSSPLSSPAPRAGHRLKGRYAIEHELGRGGIGVVYLARDERLHSMPVVIKFLLDVSERNAWLAKKFLQEAEALTRINHPGVVRVIDRDTTDDGRPFFVMEFVSGEPLRQAMKNDAIDFERAAQILRQTGQALAAAHTQGVIHRDLKPENILLQRLTTGEEQAKLIDFGIAKVEDSQSGAATEVAMVAGSLQYISPEQLNAQPVTAATDIYALGIIAYEMLTRRRPFNPEAKGYAAAVRQLAALQQAEQIIRPRQLRPDLPEAAEALILGALAYDPARRPQNARIFGDELARALTGAPSTGQTSPAEVAPTVDIARETSPVSPVSPAARAPHASPASPASGASGAPRSQSTPEVEPGERSGRSLTGPIIAAIVAVLLIAGIGGWAIFSQLSDPRPNDASTSEAARGANQAANVSELEIDYSITLQKDPKRYPGSKPFELPGEVIFSPGDLIRINFTSPQAGHLYIINEGPAAASSASSGSEASGAASAGSLPSYNTLFPSPTSNDGSSELAPGRTIRIPERGSGFVFDEEEGTELLWIIWSTKAIPELEALKRWANPGDGGAIKDEAQVAALRDFIARRSSATNRVEKNENEKRTIIRSSGDALVHLIKLEHH